MQNSENSEILRFWSAFLQISFRLKFCRLTGFLAIYLTGICWLITWQNFIKFRLLLKKFYLTDVTFFLNCRQICLHYRLRDKFVHTEIQNHFRWRSNTLKRNISGSTEPIPTILYLFESPWLGLYDRPKIVQIWQMDAKILHFKVCVY